MTRKELFAWVTAHDCQPELPKGVNVTAWNIRIVNQKNKRYAYFKTPVDATELPDNYVRKICMVDLWIPCPDNIKE